MCGFVVGRCVWWGGGKPREKAKKAKKANSQFENIEEPSRISKKSKKSKDITEIGSHSPTIDGYRPAPP